MKTLALQGEKKEHFRLFLPDPAVGAADRGADGGAGGEKSLTANIDTPVHRGELRRFDGDGAITAADAVLTMRASMGIIQAADSGMLDVDGSEDIDIADALLVMRFAMGLIG